MYIGDHARERPDHPAVIMASSGQVITYAELFAGANRVARYLRAVGLRPGDHYAVFAENHPRYFEAVWAGLNSGLHVTPINSHLTAAEAAYIVNDSGAVVLLSSHALGGPAQDVAALSPSLKARLSLDDAFGSFDEYETIAGLPGDQLDDERRGTFMFYSSGTTGQPKGVQFELPTSAVDEGDLVLMSTSVPMFGFSPAAVYLSPAPLYHAAPLRVSCVAQCVGTTIVVMESFDAEAALAAIEHFSVTSAQWVPTMFVRMLKLDEPTRTKYDLSSLRVAVHAAAPCPVDIKRRMIEWWGPIISEYYGGSEAFGRTGITSEQWLAHPGSVGPATAGVIHICDEDGVELPTGQDGVVYFDDPDAKFEYHNDPEKTASIEHPTRRSWRTMGDIGHLDADGYLYLTDRRNFVIVSGGVNIYPQEIENLLVGHPAITDIAVFGVPNEEFGEEVKAVVQPRQWPESDAEREALRTTLLQFCRANLAAYKCPRTMEFSAQLPRLDNGKLYKRALRDQYWPTAVG